jgi:DNA invertase Pin-like site-specific DNA recombinase
MSKRAFCYLRISTAEQAEDVISLKQQVSDIKAFCARNGFELAEPFE